MCTDMYWLYFLLIVFQVNLLIDSLLAQKLCEHQCANDNKCNSSYILGRCYYLYLDRARNWEESKNQCEEQGLTLTKFTHEIEISEHFSGLLNNIPDRFRNAQNKAWMGGKAINFANWSFLNNTTITNGQLDLWPNLHIDWPNKAHCGRFISSPSAISIGTNQCHLKGYFICRKNDCEVSSGNNCLQLVKELKTWFEARSHCISLEEDLFYLRSWETITGIGLREGSSLHNEIMTASSNVHIGMVHRLWTWHDGSMIVKTNWAPQEPSSGECLVMHGDSAKWYSNNCNLPLLTLCQGERIELPETTRPIRPFSTTAPSILKGSTPPDPASKALSDLKKKENTIRTLSSFLGLFFIIIVVLALIIVHLIYRSRRQTSVTQSNSDIQGNEMLATQTSKTRANHSVSSSEAPRDQTEIMGGYDYASNDSIPAEYLPPPGNTSPYGNIGYSYANDH